MGNLLHASVHCNAYRYIYVYTLKIWVKKDVKGGVFRRTQNGRKRQETGEEFRESYAGTLFTTVRYKFPMKRATT